MYNVLLVCTGNTCRSSMAEGILKDLLRKYKAESQVKVKSAGIAAFNGMGANDKAIEALRQYGIDISGHIARQLDTSLVDEADIILTMTDNHRDAIITEFPKAREKTFTLNRYLNERTGRISTGRISSFDIPDPIGRGLQTYKRTAEELMNVLEELVRLKFWQQDK